METWNRLMNQTNMARRWPARGWIGLLLVGTCWPLNWLLPGVRTAYLFFPLWLGYILAVDAWVQSRTGSSIWKRSRTEFVFLFALSAPSWWIFELINRRLANWEYLGSGQFGPLQYNVLCTISFSTVMPAVFESAELLRSFSWIHRFASWKRLPVTNGIVAGIFVIGLGMFTAMLLWPRFFYPFAWTSVLFILEPLNRWFGRRNFFQQLEQGDWRLVISLAAGAVVTGFFWELWNYYSYPKWIYHTPGVEFAHIFEMPLLGYGGYIPFGLELGALRNLFYAGRESAFEHRTEPLPAPFEILR
jgi:hypothetical protein